MTFESVLNRLDILAQEFAKKKSEHFFKVLSDGANKVGNVIDGKGKPLTAEIILEALAAC